MFNDIAIGPVTLHMYGIMIATGILAALALCLYRAGRKGLEEDAVWGIFYCAVLGGVAGARLLYYIVELPQILKDPSILWDFRTGYVVYGAILGGLLAVYAYCRVKKKPFLPYLDLVMPSLALGQGFGRIGCFCAGCCYGRETDAWYGVTFSHSAYAPNGVPLIPTQLISSAGDFAICGILLLFARKNPRTGLVAALYMLLYGTGRFLVEFLRDDYRGSVGVLSTSQFISIGIVAAGAAMMLAPARHRSASADDF